MDSQNEIEEQAKEMLQRSFKLLSASQMQLENISKFLKESIHSNEKTIETLQNKLETEDLEQSERSQIRRRIQKIRRDIEVYQKASEILQREYETYIKSKEQEGALENTKSISSLTQKMNETLPQKEISVIDVSRGNSNQSRKSTFSERLQVDLSKARPRSPIQTLAKDFNKSSQNSTKKKEIDLIDIRRDSNKNSKQSQDREAR